MNAVQINSSVVAVGASVVALACAGFSSRIFDFSILVSSLGSEDREVAVRERKPPAFSFSLYISYFFVRGKPAFFPVF